MIEEWRSITDHHNYEVSSLGRIRRVGRARSARVGRILAGGVTWNGYRFFTASCHCERTNVYVHIAVAQAFLGPRPSGRVVNHKNGVKLDCRVANLEYITQSENIKHALALGTHPRGSARTQAKLHENDVLLAWELKSDGWGPTKIGRALGVTQSIISDIFRGKRWMHVQYTGG